MFRDPALREYLEYLSLGVEIAIGLSLPIFIGYWIDNKLETSPWFLLFGIVIGLGVMIGIGVRLYKKLNKEG